MGGHGFSVCCSKEDRHVQMNSWDKGLWKQGLRWLLYGLYTSTLLAAKIIFRTREG